MLLQVTIPDGLFPGDEMMVAHGSQEFTITVPEGVHGGDMLDVDLPVDEHDSCGPPPTSLPSPSSVIVAVPDGLYEGQEFTVSFDDREFNICVPQGCRGGDEIEVEVPEAEEPLRKSPRHTREEMPPELPLESPESLVDMRAMVCGLVSNGLLNRKKGTLVSYDETKGLFSLAIDKMYPHVFIRRENLLPLPWEEEPDDSNDEEPLQAPPAGVHYVGDRVNVERSSGTRPSTDSKQGPLRESCLVSPQRAPLLTAAPPQRVLAVTPSPQSLDLISAFESRCSQGGRASQP